MLFPVSTTTYCKKKILIFIFIILILPSLTIAETLYIKSNKTKLKKEMSPSSETLMLLEKNTELDLLKKKGKFYKVKLKNGQVGWLFKFKVTNKKPKGKDKGLFAKLGGSNIGAKESTSGSSIRGLSKISEDYAKNEGIRQDHIDSVKKMETFPITENEIDQFLKQGKLGEYAN